MPRDEEEGQADADEEDEPTDDRADDDVFGSVVFSSGVDERTVGEADGIGSWVGRSSKNAANVQRGVKTKSDTPERTLEKASNPFTHT